MKPKKHHKQQSQKPFFVNIKPNEVGSINSGPSSQKSNWQQRKKKKIDQKKKMGVDNGRWVYNKLFFFNKKKQAFSGFCLGCPLFSSFTLIRDEDLVIY